MVGWRDVALSTEKLVGIEVRLVVKLLLVDGQCMFREAFEVLVSRHSDLQYAGGCDSAKEAVELVERTTPDLVIMELPLRGESGLMVARSLLARWPLLKVMFLTMHSRAHYAAEAFAIGVKGYALKAESSSAVFEAARLIVAGGEYLSPAIDRLDVDAQTQKAAVVQATLRHRAGSTKAAHDPLSMLSKRETQIFWLLIQGHDNTEMAHSLGIRIRTIETHRAHIFQKMELHSLTDLLRFAVLRGYVLAENHLVA